LIQTEFDTSALFLNQIHCIILLIFSAPCEALCEWHPLLEQSTKNMSISRAIVFKVAPSFHYGTTPKVNNFPIPITKNDIHHTITSETGRHKYKLHCKVRKEKQENGCDQRELLGLHLCPSFWRLLVEMRLLYWRYRVHRQPEPRTSLWRLWLHDATNAWRPLTSPPPRLEPC
jgi:hypothetical protein